jgi:hypothetical protein
MIRKTLFVWAMVLVSLASGFSQRLQQPLVAPSSLPIMDHLNDGAPQWSRGPGWLLNDANRFGRSGTAWVISESGAGISSLSWNKTIDLSIAVTPKLHFISKTNFEWPYAASVYIEDEKHESTSLNVASSSGNWTEVVIDLTAYRGHQIRIQWLWHAFSSEDYWIIDDVTVEDTVSPAATMLITPYPSMDRG